MLPFEDRFSRQRCLPDVGQAGQRRLCAARCVVPTDPSGRIEAEYLGRAGLQVESRAGCEVQPDDARLAFFHEPAALDLARGAWRAVRRIRQELDSSA